VQPNDRSVVCHPIITPRSTLICTTPLFPAAWQKPIGKCSHVQTKMGQSLPSVVSKWRTPSRLLCLHASSRILCGREENRSGPLILNPGPVFHFTNSTTFAVSTVVHANGWVVSRYFEPQLLPRFHSFFRSFNPFRISPICGSYSSSNFS
jgi:hypothetical protein